ncbi:MAG TPA: DoxX family protein [Chloroflexota bacterium]|nr:DoxX family protein [Chloroflexota bacterium]
MRDLGLLLLRTVVGAIFVVHGYPKIFGGPGKIEKLPPKVRQHLGPGFDAAMERGSIASFRGNVESTGVPMPGVMAWAAALAEFGGGVLLILGWLTRPAALALCGNMVVAVSRVHWKNGLVGQGGYEFPLSLLGALGALLLAGPGAISIDGDE